MLSKKETLDWIQLIRTPNIGPITFHRLIAKYGTAANALDALPELSRKAGRKTPFKASERSAASAELNNADRRGAQIIASAKTNTR